VIRGRLDAITHRNQLLQVLLDRLLRKLSGNHGAIIPKATPSTAAGAVGLADRPIRKTQSPNMNVYHPRIYPANLPILKKHGIGHPATRVLTLHAEACDICVGKEIKWPDQGNIAIDQSWFSNVRLKKQAFSSFAYEFISYDLILDGWLAMSSEPTKAELNHLEHDDGLMRSLLQECEIAANECKNDRVLPMISTARDFLNAYTHAIKYRFQVCGITPPRAG
jgi:hypothetical protein